MASFFTTEICYSFTGVGLILISDVEKVKNMVMRFTKFFRILKSKASCKVLQKDPMNS